MKTFAEVHAQFPDAVKASYNFANATYTGALNRITGIVCSKHGEFSQYAAQLRKGRGCPSCGGDERSAKRRMSPQDFVSECTKKHGGAYTYERTQYVAMAKRVTVTCPAHGDFSITALKHYYELQGCSKCEHDAKKARIVRFRHLSADAKIANTAKTFFEKCAIRHNGIYTYPEQDYEGAKKVIRVLCPNHGEFFQNAWKHLSGHGCPSCGQKSSQEAVIATFLAQYTTVVTRARDVIPPKEVDIWLPDLGIGVEYHGLFWHTEDRVGMVHRSKWEMAQAAGVRLIQIFEDEWLDNPEVVKGRLLAAVGQAPRRFARSTTIRAIGSKEAREFLDQTHTQGGSACTVAYGAFDGDTLVAVATFGKARSGAMTASASDVWEVYRYASTGVVVGGFSRLLKAFIRDVRPTEIVSYCDLRYGTGGLYKAAGFELESVTPPDYWWVPPGKCKRIARYQTQKHKLKTHPVLKEFYREGLTERQVCDAAGWKRIYGVGSQKWVMRL
jgi:protein-arginine kinase activator protein McsA